MIDKILRRLDYIEIGKFLFGGGSAVFTDFVAYYFLKQYIDVSLAKTISYIIGATVGFVINKNWTFNSRGFSLIEVIKYVLLYLCSAFANTIVNKVVLLMSGYILLAFFCATGFSTIINYLGQKFFVFRKDSI